MKDYNEQYLFQKFGYNVKEVNTPDDIMNMKFSAFSSKISYFAYDTETTGLNIIKDKPFLVIFGFAKNIYYWRADFKEATYAMYDIVTKYGKMLFAHNAKFDYHMLKNIGTPIPENIELSDSMTIARLVDNADDEFASMKLEKIGERYVDKSAKFAGHIIKKLLQDIKKERKKKVCSNYKIITGEKSFKQAWETYMNRVQFITEYHECFDEYKEPTYYDVYLTNKELVCNYACDDVVIILEFLKNIDSLYVNKYRNPDGTVNTVVWKRENKLLRYIAETERNGFTVDVKYLVDSHYRVQKYQKELYDKLHEITGDTWKVGQHKTIMDFFNNKYGLNLENCDKKTINKLCKSDNKEIETIAKLIKTLRTVDKWLSTYIDGVLNKISVENGEYKLHTTINNNGTVSGRVSCDLQQMPKYAIEVDEEIEEILGHKFDDRELFHPRRYIIPTKGYSLYFSDYSQLEMRIQAFYTIISGSPDEHLCKAYMPYNCINIKTKELFNFKNPNHIDRWNEKINNESAWIDNETGKPWLPTDLHTKITLAAFPEFEGKTDTKEFKKQRYLGKSTNFGKIYCIGPKSLADNLDIPLETAQKLSDSFDKTFPGVKVYWNETQGELALKGYTTNLYNRRYYIENSNNSYKVNNYRIQGSGADMLKEVEIKICEYLKDKKSRFILPIHDELCVEVACDEEDFVPREIERIMEDVKDKIPYLPIVAEVEMTTTNWAEKKPVYFD